MPSSALNWSPKECGHIHGGSARAIRLLSSSVFQLREPEMLSKLVNRFWCAFWRGHDWLPMSNPAAPVQERICTLCSKVERLDLRR